MEQFAPAALSKELTANDTAATGGHQAGIHVPKRQDILSFFPALDDAILNPRDLIEFIDESGLRWRFAFIYYNNFRWGGTRNEYRLTRMTKYLRERGLRAGDKLLFQRGADGSYLISYARRHSELAPTVRLKLADSWRVIPIK